MSKQEIFDNLLREAQEVDLSAKGELHHTGVCGIESVILFDCKDSRRASEVAERLNSSTIRYQCQYLYRTPIAQEWNVIVVL